jgi:hypothetical protein
MVGALKKIALVDFDGVILRSKEPNVYIKNKIEKYVKKSFRLKDMASAEKLNKELYIRYGHTYLGLQKMGKVSSLRDFNEYVYGDTREYNGMTLTKEENKEWQDFLAEMKKLDIQVKLFSNADKRWMANFIGYNPDYFSFHDLMSLYEEPFYSRLLKPKRDIYDLANSKYPDGLFYFIDDKVSNFGPIYHDMRWHNLWISTGDVNEAKYTKLGDRLYSCIGLPGAAYYIVDGVKV